MVTTSISIANQMTDAVQFKYDPELANKVSNKCNISQLPSLLEDKEDLGLQRLAYPVTWKTRNRTRCFTQTWIKSQT